MGKSHAFASLFCLVLAIAVSVRAIGLNLGTISSPGPGFLPFYAGLLLGVLSVVSLIQAVRDAGATEIWAGSRPVKICVLLFSLVLYGLLLERLGFVVCTFLLLLYLFRVLKPYKPLQLVLFSVLTTAGTWIFFVYLLDSQLPAGIWRW